jgi:ADP-ribosylglycohydrolase
MSMPAPPLANSFWVEPGRLLAGEYPGDRDRTLSQARLDTLIQAGISYFIDLTQAGEMPPYDHLLPSERADDGRYIVYVRKAIRDHGVPDSAASLVETLDYIDRAMEVGHVVYVHCRAGIGRTNTVLGCWLRREGFTGPESLQRLNALWQANARAKSWPIVPENAAQERFVLDWREPLETDAPRAPDLDAEHDAQAEVDLGLDLDATRTLRERYLGSLLGLACGDAMGATLQFKRPGQFSAITDLQGGGYWQLPRGAWTDDTAMTLCVAESLLAKEGFDAADQLRRHRRWQREGYLSSTGQCIGITAAVAAALKEQPTVPGLTVGEDSADRQERSRDGEPPVVSEAARVNAQALCRVGAVALFAVSSTENAQAWSLASVALTERSPRLEAACRYYASLLIAALRGATRQTLLAEAQALSGDVLPPLRFEASWAGAAAGTGDPLETLQLVIRTVLGSAGFRDGLLQIVNLGGDADIHGALYGQLAGALDGIDAIPKTWHRAVLRRELIVDIADRLLVAALSPRD